MLNPKNIRQWTIIKNTDRYPNIDQRMPLMLTAIGTFAQAEEAAVRLSNWNAGCDYSYYVEGDNEGEN